MARLPEPLERREFETRCLIVEHPPVRRHANKEKVFSIACPPGTAHRGTIRYSHWPVLSMPETADPADAAGRLDGRPHVYDYAPAAGGSALEWHVNFADPHLFGGYGSALFAQDEMQVAEHPALGALKEALSVGGRPVRTVEEGHPTPVLVMGVERRCRVATDVNAREGRPSGLYGNAFARASEDSVRRATTPIDPPTITNLVAIAAPSGGRGKYDASTIERVLTTAFSGFRAAVAETVRHRGEGTPVIVHSGFWGCGAFGGNRVLMAMLQAVAASMARIERLVFHCVNEAGLKALDAARARLHELSASTESIGTHEPIGRIAAMGFEWGVSNGN